MDARHYTASLQGLLKKYGVPEPAGLTLGVSESGEAALAADGAQIPLAPWRWEPRFVEMKRLLNSGRAGTPCVLRSGRIAAQGASLRLELMRELDLAEWLLDSAAVSVYAVMNNGAANVVARLESGTVATLEVAVCLTPGAKTLDRHEINTRRGVISDRVVDTQVPQSSVYLFGEDLPKCFTDVDFELYGLNAEESAVVRAAFSVLRSGHWEEQRQNHCRMEALAEAAFVSAAQNQRIALPVAQKGDGE